LAGFSDLPPALSSPSVDPEEVARFSAIADSWWDPRGKFKPLHRINPVRIGFIRQRLTGHFGLDEAAERPLEGLRILDIGCGGGLLAEPLARLGARVTGVDASEKNIKTAKTHAQLMGLEIDYRHGSAELLAAAGENFDAVMNMEVVEHVTDPAAFLAACGALVRPGGMMVVATINRTAKAFALAIFGAEYVLRWLPRGTHQLSRFLTPQEIAAMLAPHGFTPERPAGVVYHPLTGAWHIGDDTSVNYMLAAAKI
jgi:2-polyprenyl-6-hydroxyphenyl methylase/3-demethylubiquinone-9 3-methyltransferase